MIDAEDERQRLRRKIGETVAALRRDRGLRVEQLAEHAGVDPDELRAAEAGLPCALSDALVDVYAAYRSRRDADLRLLGMAVRRRRDLLRRAGRRCRR